MQIKDAENYISNPIAYSSRHRFQSHLSIMNQPISVSICIKDTANYSLYSHRSMGLIMATAADSRLEIANKNQFLWTSNLTPVCLSNMTENMPEFTRIFASFCTKRHEMAIFHFNQQKREKTRNPSEFRGKIQKIK